MRLLVIRHAIAEPRESFSRTGADDGARPLTKDGRKRMRAAARGLRALVPAVDVLATSGLVRAVQTAEIVAAAYGGVEAVAIDALAPDARPPALLAWLRTQREESVVAVVGHEPHLGRTVGWFLAGRDVASVAFKKGGAGFLSWDARPRQGTAVLRWLLTPGQLRRLGE